MKTHLVPILICLVACGHAPPHNSTPATTDQGAPAGSGAGAGSGDTNAPADHARKRGDAGEFAVKDTEKASRPAQGKLKPTATDAAVRFFVVDKDDKPIEGVVISLTSSSGTKYFTEETDASGFAEVLVPIGQSYSLVYLSLGPRNVSAKVDVANKPNLNLKLTLRYKVDEYPNGLVLENVEFPTGKATLIGDSPARLDAVVDYMMHKKSVKVEISGHTDNVGDKKVNKALSQKRADAVRDYLVSKGIDGARIKAVGYGDAKPIAPNTTEEGRQKNRRIEANQL
jgi:OOP family OmpA-OmpF porin